MNARLAGRIAAVSPAGEPKRPDLSCSEVEWMRRDNARWYAEHPTVRFHPEWETHLAWVLAEVEAARIRLVRGRGKGGV